MDQIRTRRATLDDLDILLSFEQGIIETERPFDSTVRSGPDVHYYDLAAMITSTDAQVLVAELGTEIIGSGYVRIEKSDSYLKHTEHAYLGFMYVVPEHRGKGVNKKILKELEAWSLARGVTEVRLEVYDANDPALRAYEKAGYEKVTVWMRKDLKND